MTKTTDSPTDPRDDEDAVAANLQQKLRDRLFDFDHPDEWNPRTTSEEREQEVFEIVARAIPRLGRFCQTVDGTVFFLRWRDGRFYRVTGKASNPLAQVLGDVTGLGVRNPLFRGCLDRLIANVHRTSDRLPVVETIVDGTARPLHLAKKLAKKKMGSRGHRYIATHVVRK